MSNGNVLKTKVAPVVLTATMIGSMATFGACANNKAPEAGASNQIEEPADPQEQGEIQQLSNYEEITTATENLQSAYDAVTGFDANIAGGATATDEQAQAIRDFGAALTEARALADQTEADIAAAQEAARERLLLGLGVLSRRAGVSSEVAGRLVDPGFADALMDLMALVLKRNEVVNLTTITEPVEFVELQFLDSLAPVGMGVLEEARSVADVGTGAGFPGLPLALLYPEKRFLLTDALRKRTDFVREAAGALGLSNAEVLHGRAEAVGQRVSFRERFDLAVCRAVGALPVILEYGLPLVRVGGAFLAYKTVRAKGEIAGSLLAREMLGAAVDVEVATYADLLPQRAHALYVLHKTSPTPARFPRREGVPGRVPL